MFSDEIQKYLEMKNYILTNEEYVYITNLNNNPQINHIKFNPFENTFLIETKDNYSWIVRVKN